MGLPPTTTLHALLVAATQRPSSQRKPAWQPESSRHSASTIFSLPHESASSETTKIPQARIVSLPFDTREMPGPAEVVVGANKSKQARPRPIEAQMSLSGELPTAPKSK